MKRSDEYRLINLVNIEDQTPHWGHRSTDLTLGAWTRRHALKIAILLSPIFYILLWNLIIRHDLLSILRIPLRIISSSLFQSWAEVRVSAHAEVVVWRRGIIPMYWSRIGDLSLYHTLFSLAYIFYISTLILKVGRGSVLDIQKKLTFLDYKFVKKFWLAFGVIAFLTTSLSTVAILSDVLALIYYFAYLVSLPMAPLSLYIWSKRNTNSEQSSDAERKQGNA